MVGSQGLYNEVDAEICSVQEIGFFQEGTHAVFGSCTRDNAVCVCGRARALSGRW
jgi:hypothetical protein